MAVRFDQRLTVRPGQPPHATTMTIACEHGRFAGRVEVVNGGLRHRAEVSRVTVIATHKMLHRLIAAHGRRWDCRCARTVLLWCWPNLETRLTVGAIAAGCKN